MKVQNRSWKQDAAKPAPPKRGRPSKAPKVKEEAPKVKEEPLGPSEEPEAPDLVPCPEIQGATATVLIARGHAKPPKGLLPEGASLAVMQVAKAPVASTAVNKCLGRFLGCQGP